jgi:hypothetical protein
MFQYLNLALNKTRALACPPPLLFPPSSPAHLHRLFISQILALGSYTHQWWGRHISFFPGGEWLQRHISRLFLYSNKLESVYARESAAFSLYNIIPLLTHRQLTEINATTWMNITSSPTTLGSLVGEKGMSHHSQETSFPTSLPDSSQGCWFPSPKPHPSKQQAPMFPERPSGRCTLSKCT